MKFGNIFVGKRLFVGCGKPEALASHCEQESSQEPIRLNKKPA